MTTDGITYLATSQIRALMSYAEKHNTVGFDFTMMPSELCKYNQLCKCRIDGSSCPRAGCSKFVLKCERKNG